MIQYTHCNLVKHRVLTGAVVYDECILVIKCDIKPESAEKYRDGRNGHNL
jgi:hypothetical protein